MKKFLEGAMPVEVDFGEGAVSVNPEALTDPALDDMADHHVLLDRIGLHRSTDETGIVLAESHLMTEAQPSLQNPESVVLSWRLQYSDGFEATRYTRRMMRAMETARGVVSGLRDVSLEADISNFAGYADAYRWTADSGMDLMAIVNHKDRFVSLANASGDEGTEPAFRIRPPALTEIDLPTQLQEFGTAVMMMGEMAIPGIVPLEETEPMQRVQQTASSLLVAS